MSEWIAGVDEVGRGPLIGPVVTAAVVLPKGHAIVGLADSKKLSAKRREQLAEEIRAVAVGWSIAEASAAEIDQINILQATLLAMKRAVEELECRVDRVLVDGNRLPDLAFPAEAIIKGDSKVEVISAASILAKVARDQMMVELHQMHPEYGFDRHKGYPTKKHISLIKKFGVNKIYRKTFKPVKDLI